MIKILVADVETLPHQVDVWGFYNQNIGLNQVNKLGEMCCFAAKWLGEDSITFKAATEDISRKIMLDTLWNMMDEADAILHYNGINFDVRVIQTEFAKEGYQLPSPSKHIDLYREVKRNFRLPSNKLDLVLQYFGLGKKVQHEGHELWQRVRRNEASAWKKMEEYNKSDVILLEKLYNYMKGYIKVHPNVGLYVENLDKPICRVCGSDNIVKKGKEYTQLSSYQRYKCKDCGQNLRGRLNIADRTHLLQGVV